MKTNKKYRTGVFCKQDEKEELYGLSIIYNNHLFSNNKMITMTSKYIYIYIFFNFNLRLPAHFDAVLVRNVRRNHTAKLSEVLTILCDDAKH